MKHATDLPHRLRRQCAEDVHLADDVNRGTLIIEAAEEIERLGREIETLKAFIKGVGIQCQRAST